jgi:hypothetical protein
LRNYKDKQSTSGKLGYFQKGRISFLSAEDYHGAIVARAKEDKPWPLKDLQHLKRSLNPSTKVVIFYPMWLSCENFGKEWIEQES